MIHTLINRFFILIIMLVSLLALNACDSEPPSLMKASKQFDSDEKRDQHIAYMRKHHMDALKHKRDETMYKGIRTKKHSLNACIDCHVPERYQGKVLRHTSQEHFCTTCHTYVAAKLDCFECHVDHPVKMLVDNDAAKPNKARESSKHLTFNHAGINQLNKLNSLDRQELIDLAFKFSKGQVPNKSLQKPMKSGGVSFKPNNFSDANLSTSVTSRKVDEVTNE